MSVTRKSKNLDERKKKRSAAEVIIPLVIGTLGAVGVVLAAVLGTGFKTIDVVLLLLIVTFAAVGFTQRILRGLITIPFLYVATALAATFYVQAAPYLGAPFGDWREVAPPFYVKAVVYMALMLAIWIALEAIARSFFKDMSLPGLGILDNFGGVFIYAAIGLLVATLIFTSIGYGQQWRGSVNRAKLRPLFQGSMRLFYLSQSFWFSEGRPWLYTLGLD